METPSVFQKLKNQLMIFALFRLRVWVKGFFTVRKLEREAQNVARAQERLLLRIINAQKSTEYGKTHGFSEIRNSDDFRNRVAVHDYEDLRAWIERQERENTPALNAKTPVLYTLTSGTTGKPKLIPVSKQTLKANKKIQNLFLNFLFRARPRVADGHVLTIVSPAVEGYTEHSRTPFGATTGHMYASAPGLAQKKYAIPPAIFEITDYDLRFTLILRLALQYDDITYVSTANPTTLLRLINMLNEKWDELLLGLERGGFVRADLLNEKQLHVVRERLTPRPKLAAKLREVKKRRPDGRVRFSDIWQDIQAVGVWTGGSCGIFFERLKDEFAPHTLFRDVGYHSSEFRGSIPIFDHTSAGIPSFREHYFEFVERDAWDRNEVKFLSLHELQDEREYYVFITTESGLYRYNMNDVVRVDGFFYQVPLLRFLQKGKGVTSITGEKLYENQVIAATKLAEEEFILKSTFYMMVADEQNASYTLYYESAPETEPILLGNLEAFTKTLEAKLGDLNIEYLTKLKSGRLKNLRIVPLVQNTYEAYKRACVNQGQRESQFKIIALYYKKDLSFDFANYAIASVQKTLAPVRQVPRPPARVLEGAQVS